MDEIPPPPPPPPTGAPSTESPSSPWPRVVLALGVVLILAAAIVAGIALWPRDEPTATPTSTPTESPTSPEPTAATTELTAQQIAQLYADAVWRVESEGCDYLSTGTGFVVGPRTVITNAHVIEFDATPQIISRDGGRIINTTVVGADADLDIAVLIADEDLPGASLTWVDAAELTEGQELVALGYPVPDHSFTVTPATLMSFQVDGGIRQALRLDGLVDKGNSGGPALTRTGEVAGVVTYLLAGGVQWIPVAHTHDYLAAAIDAIERERPGWEPACDERPTAPTLPDEWDWDWDDEDIEPEGTRPHSYGDDDELDGLYDACAAGDMTACDELYWASAYGSEYEEFATTCGGTESGPVLGHCAWLEDGFDDDAGQPYTYGDDPYLDDLYDACAAGDMPACDDLYFEAPIGSEYEEFGSTCGGTASGDGWCEWEYGDDGSADATSYGDDPYLDELWDECAAGDRFSCDLLYFSSDSGTEYEEFGSTCGRRRGATEGACAD